MVENLKINKEYEEKKLSALKLIRIAKDLHSEELAKELEVSRTYIYALENGNRMITHKLFAEKFEKLGINWDDFEDLERYIVKISKTDLPYETKHAKALAKAIGVGSPELKRSVAPLIRIPKKK